MKTPSKKTLMIGAALVAAYFLFFKKGAAQAAPAAPAQRPTTWQQQAISTGLDLAKQIGSNLAAEATASDGGAGASGLQGHLASMGIGGDLAGTFYGDY